MNHFIEQLRHPLQSTEIHDYFENSSRNNIMLRVYDQITKNALQHGWDVTINGNSIELKKKQNELSYSEKYDTNTFQKMCCELVCK